MKRKKLPELPAPVSYTVPELARSFGVTPRTVRKWIAQGKLHAIAAPGVRRRVRLVVTADEAAGFLRECERLALEACSSDQARAMHAPSDPRQLRLMGRGGS